MCAAALPAPGQAQPRHAVQVQGLTALADANFAGGGAGVVVGVGRRLAVGATFSAGGLDGAFAGRGELLALFVLNPFQRRGVRVYGGGGVAVTATGDATDERAVLLIGLERAGAPRAGWFVEAGIGGGVRLAAGLRVSWR